MPSFIVKDRPDVDFYVVWSTIVDAPTFWGSKAGLQANIWVSRRDGAAEERFERADRCGSSAMVGNPVWYGWEDDDFIVMELDIPDRRNGSYILKRKNLRALCDRLDAGEDPTDLLEFKEWDE